MIGLRDKAQPLNYNYQIYRFINHFFNKHIMKKVFLMLAVVAMASCSKSELSERPVVGDVEIKMGSTVLGIESRAPYVSATGENAVASDNKLTAHVLVSTVKGTYLSTDNASWWGQGDIEFGSGTPTANIVGFTPALYYPADAAKEVHLFGLYPHTGWTVNTTDGRSATYNIDGKSDLMTAETATTTKAAAQAGTYPTLSFKHLLTKFDVKVVAENQAAIDAWGKITKIELVKGLNDTDPANSVKVTFVDNSVDFTASTGVISFYGASESAGTKTYTDVKVGDTPAGGSDPEYITLATTEKLAAYSIVAPVTPTAATDVIKLKVYTEELAAGKEVPVKLEKDPSTSTPVLESTDGKEYTITLTFKATAMDVEGKVTGWGNGGSGSADVE